jgi:hypothetical protein
MTLVEDRVTALDVFWPAIKCVVRSVDVGKGTLTVPELGSERRVTLEVPSGTPVLIDALKAGLADLMPGQKMRVVLSPDRRKAVVIRAEGDPTEVPGQLKAIDSEGRSLLVTVLTRFSGNRRLDLRFPLGDKVRVRLEGADVALADLPAHAFVHLRLAEDRQTVMGIRAVRPAAEADE